MNAPTYLLAKYAPDVHRMEPRNIGVILWASSGVECKFVPTSEAHFVGDSVMYERWVKFWTAECNKSTITTKRGAVVKRRSVDFLNALIETQAGNYFLYRGGFIADHVPAGDRKNATDYLYRKLVAIPGSDGTDQLVPQDSLAQRCDALFEEVGASERDEFIPDYALELETEGVVSPFRFDYAWENGSLGALFLRVNLGVQPSTTNAAFLFEHAKNTRKSRYAERYALVMGDAKKSPELDDKIESRKRILDKLSTVVNVNDASALKSVVEPLLLQAS